MKISINEYHIRQIVEKSLKAILNEAKRFEDIVSSIKRNNPDINESYFDYLLRFGDPTSVFNDHGNFAGKYWKWITKLFLDKKININSTNRINKALTVYDRNKLRIGPIEKFDSLETLEKFLNENGYDEKSERLKQISKAEKEVKKVYEDEYFLVRVPLTHEASRKIAGDTNWCTASSDSSQFFRYIHDFGGEYYVILDKENGQKYQFHPESAQLNNAQNKTTNFSKVGDINKMFGLISYFESIRKPVFDYFGDRDMYNEYYDRCQLLSKDDYEDEYFKVFEPLNFKSYLENLKDFYIGGNGRVDKLTMYENFFSYKEKSYVIKDKQSGGTFLFVDGEGLVSVKHIDSLSFKQLGPEEKIEGIKAFFISLNKSNAKFCYDSVGSPCGGISIVIDDGAYNFLDKNYKTLSHDWFKKALSFDTKGVSGVVVIDNKCRLFFRDGTIGKDAYDYISIDLHGERAVGLNGMVNRIDSRGNILDTWKKDDRN